MSRYRKIGYNSSVDEGLFGNTKSKSGRELVSGVNATSAPNVAVVSRSDLDRIRQTSIIKTDADILDDKERILRAREERERAARERKERMIHLEERAKSKAKKSDIEIANAARSAAIKAMAEEKVVEAKDLVKLMTTLGARAAAFTIRDEQLVDKKRREEEEKEYTHRMDMIMEVDRVKDLMRREKEESAKRSKRLNDRSVITEQIAQRERDRVIAAEQRDQENKNMKSVIDRYAEEDRQAALQRERDAEKSRAEVLQANEDSIQRKRVTKQREKDENDEIERYQVQKARDMARREEEEAAIERRKKETQAALLASQERSQGRQAEVDELRARRAIEEKERIVRKKERDDAIGRKADIMRLQRDRENQAENRRRKEENEKRRQDAEDLKALDNNRAIEVREENERRTKHDNNMHHREQLQKQIEDGDARRRGNKNSKYEEGAKLREEWIAEQARLEAIREKMVRDLENDGVNPKYLSEMRNIDIGKIMKR